MNTHVSRERGGVGEGGEDLERTTGAQSHDPEIMT